MTFRDKGVVCRTHSTWFNPNVKEVSEILNTTKKKIREGIKMEKEPIFDVAQLAHVEIYSPKPDETLWFFLKSC